MRAATEREVQLIRFFETLIAQELGSTSFNFEKEGILGICVMSSFIYCKFPYRFIKKGAPYYKRYIWCLELSGIAIVEWSKITWGAV